LELLQNNTADNIKAQELVKSLQIQEKQHKIRATDRLQLNVVSLTDEKVNFLKTPLIELVVDANGQIDMPVIGLIPVAGLTIKEAEEKIEKTSADYLRSPSVSIRLMNFQITVIGEVLRQGTFILPDPRVNILEAIGQAGGLTENANRQNIRIIRSENNTAKIYALNLLEDNSLSSQNFFLTPNDIVLVNPRRALADRQQRLATISLGFSLITSFTFLLTQVINR
jgi:polysaccharide export outer membrane protein